MSHRNKVSLIGQADARLQIRVVVMDIFVCVARTENPTLFFLRSKMSIKTFKSLFFMDTSMGFTDKNVH